MVAIYRPNDPLLSSQWHLAMIGRPGFGSTNSTAGLERVWAQYSGDGVHVGIWDDGVQSTHWDLAGNYDSSRHVTVGGSLNNGQPLSNDDGHGTAVAGLIAAQNNGQGGTGVAFDTSITAIRIFGGADDINNAWSRYLTTLDSLRNFDVTNHSYGGTPDFQVYGDVAKFQAASALGRGGLGTVNVKSAGNSNIDGNGESTDGSRFTVTVAALGSNGNVASYSTYGSHVLVSAPAGSVTSDRLGLSAGYNGLLNGDYTNVFGGTSAAGPITAGVIALMIDANPELGWRDVQNILAYSAIGVGSLYGGLTLNEDFAWKWNGAGNWNGGGLHYSEDYGYGMVNAFNAVRMAEVWSVLHPVAATSANEMSVTSGVLAVNRSIADLTTLSYTFNIDQLISLEHVSMTVTLSHSYFTDLRIRLISPDQTVMSLYNGSSGTGSTSDNGFSYSFGVDGLRGELSAGNWTLQVQDAAQADTGILQSLRFTGYGSAPTGDDVYHYTEEVLTVLSQSGQSARATIADADGGFDWIDAASMVRDLVLDLGEGMSSTLAGLSFLTIAAGSLIENAIAGDGNDQIYGNALDNVLYGMRGNDILDGGGGIDTAAFFGLYTDYTVTSTGGVTTVASAIYGTDTLTNFEYLQFSDRRLELSSGDGSLADTAAPSLLMLSPADNRADVAVDANIVLTFNEVVRAGSGNIAVYNENGSLWGAFSITGPRVTFAGTSVTLDPVAALVAGGSYYVTVAAGAIVDLVGNAFAGISGNSAFNFSTELDVNGITGTAGNDKLAGTDGADRIFGMAGKDKLAGGGDDDWIDGGAGVDSMQGGLGDDTYVVDNKSDKVTEKSGAGIDTVITSLASYSLRGAVENLTFQGSSAFTGVGNALNNAISGGDGNDILNGGAGSDILAGGAGADRFVFASAAETGLGAMRDVIVDFVSGIDTIDLAAIDANTTMKGNQAFSSILVDNFSGAAGQLRLADSGSDIVVSGDINGDAIADFDILLKDIASVTHNDFVL
ncbi:S8 family serine peptidase [Pseudorhodoplanes sp.]|uniref:S8 family serine peptidase n=1 Tax=Pseudorhodoplanes sp. TaxID=1934341 RepID=UPI003D111C8B